MNRKNLHTCLEQQEKTYFPKQFVAVQNGKFQEKKSITHTAAQLSNGQR